MRRKQHNPYPEIGTIKGDEVIGVCSRENCGARIRRGDPFTVMLGDVIVCPNCHGKPLPNALSCQESDR